MRALTLLKTRLSAVGARYRARQGWIRDQRGAVMVYVALSLIPLFAMVGVATDSARGYLLQGQLGHALDAAALAGGRVINSPPAERDADITQFFYANFPAGYMGSTLEGPDIDLDISGQFVRVTATATIPTTFMRFLGEPSVTVAASTIVQAATTGLELVMVLDNTGSMCKDDEKNRDCTDLYAMQDGAQSLVDTIFGDDEQPPSLWVGLVPFITAVNIGSSRTDWLIPIDAPEGNLVTAQSAVNDAKGLQGYHEDYYLPGVWKGCVEAREDGFDVTDEKPSDQEFVPFYYPETNFGSNNRDNHWVPPAKITETYDKEDQGPNTGCPAEVTPIGASKQALTDAIAAMTTWDAGGTHASVGLVWGWRMLSPNWRGLWGGPVSVEHPVDYNTPLVDKVAILLTDGQNRMVSRFGSDFVETDYTSYGRSDWNRLGNKLTDEGVEDELDERLKTVCKSMKGEDNQITIYTIVYALSSSSVEDLMEECATSSAHYFPAPTPEELKAVFQAIADDLSDLRIAQ